MPGGITHLILALKSRNELDEKPRKILDACQSAFLVGSIAPDLPYFSGADDDVLHNEKALADHMHYENTNLIPLLAFKELKSNTGDQERDWKFAFFAGYMSHVVGDGVIHPFVRDKVGDYSSHMTEHRKLEMKLDVLFAHHEYDTNFRNSGIPLILKDFGSADSHRESVFSLFSSLILEIYDKNIAAGQIAGWLKAVQRIFRAATFLPWYGPLGLTGAAYSDYEKLAEQKSKILTLGDPPDLGEHGLNGNFAELPRVDFYEHCVPKFLEKFRKLVSAAYSFVYENGPNPMTDFQPINLDTGRLLIYKQGYDLKKKPFFWEH